MREKPMTRFACLLSLAFCLATCARAQEVEDTRGIIPAEFVKARPAKHHGPSNAAKANAAHRPLYRRTSGTAVAASGVFAQLGLTIWRLRPATAADAGARLIVQK